MRADRMGRGMAAKHDKTTPRDFVGPVQHALNVLRAFDSQHIEMTLSNVSERTGLTRAGARRYLVTLEHLGYLRKDDRLFRLTPKVLELGFAFLSSAPIAALAQPYLQEITRETGETSGLAVLDGNETVHLAVSAVQRVLAPTLTVGRRFNTLYASTGRAIAAFLEPEQVEAIMRSSEIAALTSRSLQSKEAIREELKTVRRQGYAVVDQEVEDGVRSIAVPLFNRHQQPVAAITILTNVATVSKKQLIDEKLPVLRRIAPDVPTQAL